MSILFRQWSNGNYLLDFFLANLDDLRGFFHIQKISDAIKDTMEDAQELERLILDFPYTERLDGLFHPLSLADNRAHEMTREKARNWDRERHVSWLRIYAIRIDPNVFVITGGAIKLPPLCKTESIRRLNLTSSMPAANTRSRTACLTKIVLST